MRLCHQALISVVLVLLCVSAHAQANAQTAQHRFEITPFAAWRVGGEFQDVDGMTDFKLEESNAYGIILNGAVASNTEWEVLYTRQSTDVDTLGTLPGASLLGIDLDYLQVGGTYLFDGQRVRPFIAMTIGATRFNPQPSEFKSRTFVSGSFGGGWKIGLAKNLALRVEARGYATLVDNNSRLFCESSSAGGACLIVVDGKVLAQWEARAGLTFRF